VDMMGFGAIMISVFMAYYSFYFLKFFNKNERKFIQKENKDMDKLRKIQIKPLEDQKKFINIKYPKKPKFKWQWKMIPMILWGMAKFILMLQLYRWLIFISGWNVQLWQAILFVIVIPIIINIILEKFNLQKSDIRVFLR